MVFSSMLLPVIFFFLIMFEPDILCLSSNNNFTFNDCIPRERISLLRLKASLLDGSNGISSWNNTRYKCCNWQGVKCDKATGHVIGLDIRNRVLDNYGDPSSDSMLQSETLDSSLLEMKHLKYLDLSGNNFKDSSIPSFLGSLNKPQYLNLSNAGFGCVIPHQLGNLSTLCALDLGGLLSSLRVDNLIWAANLSLLESLDMCHVNLSTTKDHLAKLPEELGKLKQLKWLDLSDNKLSGPIPTIVGQLSDLEWIDIYGNTFEGTLIEAHFEKLFKLKGFRTGSNMLTFRVGDD
ncbi:disease resistance family protein / LRR family protein [Striga hermonthica]|uniref:Disease resistance family protein / LRR family protein n=1 Tax=Striga hermonthica TaxID=68872 RepID=A0A9N7N0W7_STRHE|nr:disease resistance family protein / LRR family protein [Striga hermonthica]